MNRLAWSVGLVAVVALSGCEAPPPDPAMVALSSRCQSGDNGACDSLTRMRQAAAADAAAIAAIMGDGVQLNPQDFMRQPSAPPAMGGFCRDYTGRQMPCF